MRRSLMQRLVEREGESIYRRLTVQYRMHSAIMDFSSAAFYDGSLEADVSVRGHRLSDLPNIESTELTEDPLLLIDTAGAGMEEQLEPDGESKLNPGEGKLVLRLVRELTEAGLEPDQLGVIAPYAAQVRWLRDRLDEPRLEIDTVDGFQGREKEAIIVTMVRSNGEGEIGFLKDTRRTNVALTRARRKLIVIGDSATLAANEFYASLWDYFEQAGAYRSVWEFSDE
jgi:superfamily I DNA and/or RNA helicase